MGHSTVWIMAESMLSGFDILKPLDEYGTPIDSTVEYNFSLTLYACFFFFFILSYQNLYVYFC